MSTGQTFTTARTKHCRRVISYPDLDPGGEGLVGLGQFGIVAVECVDLDFEFADL